jgi:hypothetical protein
VPVPQRDLRIRSFFGHEGQDALQALNLERAPDTPTPVALPTTNDAAEDLMQPEKPVDSELTDDDEPLAAEKRTA